MRVNAQVAMGEMGACDKYKELEEERRLEDKNYSLEPLYAHEIDEVIDSTIRLCETKGALATFKVHAWKAAFIEEKRRQMAE